MFLSLRQLLGHQHASSAIAYCLCMIHYGVLSLGQPMAAASLLLIIQQHIDMKRMETGRAPTG